MKSKLTSFLKKLSWQMAVVAVLTLVAAGGVWTYAAFIEPVAGPADSDQDFTQNILGANNANNDFDSSLVASNNDGSLIERIEYIIDALASLWTKSGNDLYYTAGKVGIGTTTPLYKFSMNSGSSGFGIDSSGIVQQGTWQGTEIADSYISNTLTVDNYMQDEDINTFDELQSWVNDETLLKAGTLTDTKYCIYDSASTDIICNSEGGGSSFSSIATLNALMTGESVASTTQTWADAYINSSATWNAKLDSADIDTLAEINAILSTETIASTSVATLSSLTSIGTIGTGTWEATDIGVEYGGTGVSSLTDHGVLVGSGTGALTALTVGTNGQLLVGSTGADPVFATLNADAHLTATLGAGTIELDVDDDWYDSLSDITLAHQSIFVGDSSGHPAATSTITILDSGNVGIGTTTPGYTLDVTGNIRASSQVRAEVAVGTAPLVVNSTTKVANLNADLLDGFDSSAFGDATLANQTTILNRIGQNTDAASMSDSLFAGQQYIADHMRVASMYLTSVKQDGDHNCDATPSNCCESGYHMCYVSEMLGRDVERTGTGRDTTPGNTYGDVNDDSSATTNCTGWSANNSYNERAQAVLATAVGGMGVTIYSHLNACDELLSQWCCSD